MYTHTQAHVYIWEACVGVYAVAGNHGTKLESVRILSRTSQTCCLRRLVRLATPYYGPSRLKSIKFDHSSILSSFVSVLEIERSVFRKKNYIIKSRLRMSNLICRIEENKKKISDKKLIFLYCLNLNN